MMTDTECSICPSEADTRYNLVLKNKMWALESNFLSSYIWTYNLLDVLCYVGKFLIFKMGRICYCQVSVRIQKINTWKAFREGPGTDRPLLLLGRGVGGMSARAYLFTLHQESFHCMCPFLSSTLLTLAGMRLDGMCQCLYMHCLCTASVLS